MRSDLAVLFVGLVGVLDLCLLLALLASGADGFYIVSALPYVAGVNLCVAVMLRWAGIHLSRAWAERA